MVEVSCSPRAVDEVPSLNPIKYIKLTSNFSNYTDIKLWISEIPFQQYQECTIWTPGSKVMAEIHKAVGFQLEIILSSHFVLNATNIAWKFINKVPMQLFYSELVFKHHKHEENQIKNLLHCWKDDRLK